jgi:hypothetical protein
MLIFCFISDKMCRKLGMVRTASAGVMTAARVVALLSGLSAASAGAHPSARWSPCYALCVSAVSPSMTSCLMQLTVCIDSFSSRSGSTICYTSSNADSCVSARFPPSTLVGSNPPRINVRSTPKRIPATSRPEAEVLIVAARLRIWSAICCSYTVQRRAERDS